MPIVAAVDKSERAEPILEQARSLTTAFDTDLHVVHVGEFSVGNLVSGSTEETSDIEEAKSKAQQTAKEIGSQAGSGQEFEPVGLIGDPAEEILKYSEEISADYIVVSGRKRSPTGKALFGSVVQSILLDANRPVVSVMQ
ncbi:universal stress protein [Haloarcula amylovorans]|uniref:universal stress protein n=1 Tax=Haloarcula amylovorans TaxID=2562280 RepID=UPI0010767A83|nr:universal stress protein [Halomicroarcula amylolytica]